ncbi:hypothetical protein GC175_13035 [bacterium]|nr:hypothetical protein [bacterium]
MQCRNHICWLGVAFIASIISILAIAYPNSLKASPSLAENMSVSPLYLPNVVRESMPTPTVTPTSTAVPTATPPPTLAPQWLALVNEYRDMARLPHVSENEIWSHGDWLHARYMVKNDVSQHFEDPNNEWYTPEGDAAARASNLTSSYQVDATDVYAIDSWMQAPFHAVGILDPRLAQVGYGVYREAGGGRQMAAALDVIRGISSLPSDIQFPIVWPADGTTVPLTEHWGENPSPLTSCPGYETPSGLPIILQLGSRQVVPNVTGHAFVQEETPLEHCVFDETNYINPDPAQQDIARRILDSRDAIVLIPRQPLTPGATYTASITVNGSTYIWSFNVSSRTQGFSVQRFDFVPQ